MGGLLVLPGKVYQLRTDHLITGLTAQVSASPGKVVQVNSSLQISLIGLVGWLYFQANLWCHDILMSCKSLIKWRYVPTGSKLLTGTLSHNSKPIEFIDHNKILIKLLNKLLNLIIMRFCKWALEHVNTCHCP